MKTNSLKTGVVAMLTAWLATFTPTTHANIFAVATNATPYTAFDGAIAPNLILSGQSSLASVAYNGPAQTLGFTVAGLNDGSTAANANKTYINGGFPFTVTFNLNTNSGTGGSSNGYDISAVQCISGWTDSYFANQNFQVLFSINGGAFSVASGNCVGTSSLGGGNNCVMGTFTNDVGPIARNVTAIQFQFFTPAANSQMVIHELQAFGTPSATGAPPVPTVVAIMTNGASYNALDGLIVPNLLRAGQSSLGGVVTSHIPASGWTDANLNDGAGNATAGNSAGLVYYPTPGTVGGFPVTITFNLNTNNGTGGSANGYDLRSVQALCGWADTYFADQNFQLLLSTNGGPFYNFGNFAGSCALNGGNNSMMTTVTNLTGIIAKNVTAIQLVFSRSATGNGGIVIRELQAFGSPSSAAGPAPIIVTTQQSGTAANTYDGSVAVNLIQNGQQSLAGVYASGSASTALGSTSALNDGSAAANANLTYFYGADGVLPAVITYYLNTDSGTGSPNGYNITNVQAISGWTDSYFADQKFQLLFSINGGAFQDYGTYSSYNNLNGNSGVSVLKTVGGSGGLLATNVTAVRFVLQNPGGHDITTAGGHYAGTVYRELQVFGSPVAPPFVAINHFPKPVQLYPRDLVTGYAQVLMDGTVIDTNCTQVSVAVTRNGVLYTNLGQPLAFSNGSAPFSINVPILAELAGYDFQLVVTRNGTNVVVASASDVVAGDVYLINGQSNAEATMYAGSANGNTNRYLRSFGTRDDSGATVAADLSWHLADGDILYGPGAVGQWGLRLGRLILDTYGIPVAIVNGARGGWPISSFQRNDANRQDLNTDYGRTLFRATQAGVQNSIRAILWYQGESDNGDADAHDKGWSTLHDNWHQDYPSIEKIYLFQVHVGCGVDQFNVDLRNRQRLFADRFNDVEVMSTTGVGNTVGNCHYPYANGYDTHATNIFRLMQRDLYAAAPQNNIEAPNPYYAYFSAPGNTQITVIMKNSSDTLSFATGAEADFRLEGSAVTVAAGLAVGNTLVLTLNGNASGATGLTYGNHAGAAAPAIVNANGVGLLAFYNLPIQPGLGAPGVPAWVASAPISSDRIDITWAAATNAAEYLIRRDGTVIGKTTGTVFTDQTVFPGPLFSYQIAAVSPVSTSAWSSVTSATTVPNNVFAFVPESTNFTVLYQLNIPNDLRLGTSLKAPYDLDNSDAVTKPFDRVAYYVELQTDPGQPLKWVYVSCAPFSLDPKLLGVPSLAAGAIFHQPITNLNVYASAGAGVPTGQGLSAGNIEFWGWNYQTANGYGVPGASDSVYDSGDTIDTGGTYGSMQIFQANQALFAYNAWGTYTADTGTQSSDDLGIGNQPTGHPDWTFAANCFRYTYKRMYVLVRPVNPVPLTFAFAADGNHLQLSWPATESNWRLQIQTNDLTKGLSTNWWDVTGEITNPMTISIDPAGGSVFYRLVYP